MVFMIWALKFRLCKEQRLNWQTFLTDPYTVLQVSRGSSLTEIKTAYRRLAKIYHPDIPTGSEEKFKQLSSAYDTLLKLAPTDKPSSQPPPRQPPQQAPRSRPGYSQTFYRVISKRVAVVYFQYDLPSRSRVVFMDVDAGGLEFEILLDEHKPLPFTVQQGGYTIQFRRGLG
jgi:hypothetical protein